MNPRILLLSASSTEGHVHAGNALEKAFELCGLDVKRADVFEYVSKSFLKFYLNAHVLMVRRAPRVQSDFLDHIDQLWRHPLRRMAFDHLNPDRIIRLFEGVQPDLCVTTHYLAAEMVARLKAKRKIATRLAVVVTDYDAHAMWLCRNVNRYYVAREETAEYLAALGLPRETLRVSGIPVDPVFAEVQDRRAARLDLGLDPCRAMVLVYTGGYVVSQVERLITDLLAAGRPRQIVAITGKATHIRRRLEKLGADGRKLGSDGVHLKVIGSTNEMHRWMAAADILVGKPGGLTVSEALACGLAMAFLGALPGRSNEDRNADYVLEHGAGIRCYNFPTAGWKIGQLLDDAVRLDAMRVAAKALARPRAAIDIAEDCTRQR